MEPTIWRWDQGRLIYFQFSNLKKIAECLVALENVDLSNVDDPLRTVLEGGTGLPFLPKTYKVWRNYKRVFECAFLATNIHDRLYVTDICKKLASDSSIDADEYFSFIFPRFRYPFPAFSGEHEQVMYPYCVILKKLFSLFLERRDPSLDVDEVFSFLIGNECTGLEPVEFYSSLTQTTRRADTDERRQVRELLISMSQISILKWYDNRLRLDITQKDYEDYNGFVELINPIAGVVVQDRVEDFIKLTSLPGTDLSTFQLQSREIPTDDLFIEGRRTRITHIKIERSPLLRRLFFARHPGAECDMCTHNMRYRYPWTDNILEVHHVLPLSSSISITTDGTSLDDVVGLCPNCHRSVHVYYKNWLNNAGLNDFRSKTEAKEVYEEARSSTVLT